MVTILIHEFQSWLSVKIFEGGEFPRVRSAGSLAHFNVILKEELAHFKQMGIEVSFARKNAGKFGGVKWKDIAKLRQPSKSLVIKDLRIWKGPVWRNSLTLND